MARFTSNYIENQEAYDAAVRRRIQENARKGRGANWLVKDETRKGIVSFLQRYHGAKGFLGEMAKSYEDYNSLTPNQESAVRKIMDKTAERRKEFAARDARSEHVGTMGKREIFENLTVSFATSYETDLYGTMWIYGMRDDSGNVLIYKGQSQGINPGDVVSGKATIKAHSVREGVKQTILSRPKFTKGYQS